MTVRIANSSIVSRLLVTLMLAVASPSYSELIIRVTQGNDQPTKIAIAPIAMGGVQSSEDVSAIVEATWPAAVCSRPWNVAICSPFQAQPQRCTTVTGVFWVPNIWLLAT